MTTNNDVFAVTLLDASQDPSRLGVWQTGTMAVVIAGDGSVTGELALPSVYTEPMPFTGGAEPPGTSAGRLISASGKNAQLEITLMAVCQVDGFLFTGSYIGGLVSMYDRGAEETYLYVMQGLSQQGASTGTARTSPAGAERNPR